MRRLRLQIGLMVLPLIALLVIGIYFLKQDRRVARREARENAQDLAERLLSAWIFVRQGVPTPEFVRNSVPWNPDEVYFLIGTNNELAFPKPIQKAIRQPP